MCHPLTLKPLIYLGCIIHEMAEPFVIPAEAGIHSGVSFLTWIPVFTGMTADN
jgi:hypothetical protein